MDVQEDLTEEENENLQLQELETLDEMRLEAQQHLESYQARLSKAFNKKVRPRFFPNWRSCLSITKAYHHNSQDKKQVHITVGWTLCNTRGLHQWPLLNHGGRRLEDRPNQWQILEALLPLNQTNNAPCSHELKRQRGKLLAYMSLNCTQHKAPRLYKPKLDTVQCSSPTQA